MERAMGIEPTSVAWEATALPLSYARVAVESLCAGAGVAQWLAAPHAPDTVRRCCQASRAPCGARDDAWIRSCR